MSNSNIQKKCLHRQIMVDINQEAPPEFICRDCRAIVDLKGPQDGHYDEDYFEFLIKEDDGSFIAFHRTCREQAEISKKKLN